MPQNYLPVDDDTTWKLYQTKMVLCLLFTSCVQECISSICNVSNTLAGVCLKDYFTKIQRQGIDGKYLHIIKACNNNKGLIHYRRRLLSSCTHHRILVTL